MVTAKNSKIRHERRLGESILNYYRDTVELCDLSPNDNQPRLGKLDDLELQRQIEGNGGIFEPLLVEPHPNKRLKFRIIDGHRRWVNSKLLVEEHSKIEFARIPVDVIDRTLTDEERLRVWICIHRQRKEWDAREKEMVAFRLVQIVGKASAANILGLSIRQLEKLCETFDLSTRFSCFSDGKSAITWAREIKRLSKKILTPSIVDEVVRRVNEREITNSKEIRKLRQIVKDPIAEDAFLNKKLSINRALGSIPTQAAASVQSQGLTSDIQSLCDCIRSQSWTELIKLKDDPELLRRIEEAQDLLKQLKKSVSK